jgi:hypothetical protein
MIVFTTALWVAHVLLAQAEITVSEPTPYKAAGTDVVEGLYPLWENTGYTLTFKQARLAVFQLSVGAGPNLQLSVRPWSFAMRAPNFLLKYGVYKQGTLNVAVHAGLYAILRNANNAFYSAQYASRLKNADSLVMAIPLGASISWEATSWLRVHNTLTLLGLFSDEFKDRLTVGDFVSAEFKPTDRHALFLHVGEVGFWAHDMTVIGLSYRYNYKWFNVRVGYYYRFSQDGAQGQPLFDIGVIL